MDERSYRRLSWIVLALAFLALALPPVAVRVPWLVRPCPMRTWFDVPCPLCGLTRALALLLAGRPAAAGAMHPLALPVALLLLAEALFRLALLGQLLPSRLRGRVMAADKHVHALLAFASLAYGLGFSVGTVVGGK
jgi:hypothetical protein